MHVRSFIQEVLQSELPPSVINVDNQAAIRIANSSKSPARFKHVSIRHHYVRDMVKARHVIIRYIPTAVNLADTLTKNLGRLKYAKFARQILGHPEADKLPEGSTLM